MEETKIRPDRLLHIGIAVLFLFLFNYIGCLRACQEPEPITAIKTAIYE